MEKENVGSEERRVVGEVCNDTTISIDKVTLLTFFELLPCGAPHGCTEHAAGQPLTENCLCDEF